MQITKKSHWLLIKILAGALLIALVAYLVFSTLMTNRLQAIEDHTRDRIADQTALLATITETTARNGADAVTESIVRDCRVSDRSRFDQLLGQLDSGLSQVELVELERLFGRCGSFYADRKAVMVSRLNREVETYVHYVEQLGIIMNRDMTDAYDVSAWQQLAAEEQKQSELFAELVDLQDKIIAALLAGESTNASSVQTLAQEAQEVRETLAVANKQASKLRAELVSL